MAKMSREEGGQKMRVGINTKCSRKQKDGDV